MGIGSPLIFRNTLCRLAVLAALVGTSTGAIRSPGIIFDEEEGGLEAIGLNEAAYVLTVTFNEQ